MLTARDVSHLLGNNNYYGSFQVYANLSVAIAGVTSGTAYNRSLDLNTGLHTTVFKANDGNTYTSTVYCSYPDQVCVYNLSSTAVLPAITIAL
jgi:alpha-L-fucosidase 2